jgi:lipopolysaccharide export system protein LptA
VALNIPHLRRWFALGAIFIALAVAGTYIYARWRFSLVPGFIPSKINMQVQQSAKQFTVSKSEQGRTLFTIHASNAVQYKEGGHAELHDVAITIFGHDSSRFDQIYGADFDYSPNTGIVVAKGQVQIDLQANPEGTFQPDQTIPPELKNPVHLVTSGLVFNQKTGDAFTSEKVEFSVTQAHGTAVGAKYSADDGTLDLASKVNLVLAGTLPVTVDARHGVITKDPRKIDLDGPHMVRGGERLDSDHGTVFLRANNTVDHALASGSVHIQLQGKSSVDARSERAELFVAGPHNALRNAILSGNVQMQSSGAQPAQANAGRVTLNFTGKNLLATARAEENVKLVEHSAPANPTSTPQTADATAQDTEVTASAIDFVVANGRHLDTAVTAGPAQIAILPVPAGAGPRTLITAGKFKAAFDDRSHLKTVHGAPDARIVNTVPGQPDRVSTSRQLDAAFLPAGGIDSIQQEGNVAYVDAERKAWGEHARYTPADQMLHLSGSPRVVDGGMTTTARRIRMNRSTGEAFADGDVKTTYNDLKPQPNGALLASSSPIHVTARSMTTHRDPGMATYSGNARLWQDANVVAAPSIEFDRDRRFLIAHGATAQPVSTVLMQTAQDSKQTPVLVTADYLTYSDEERKAHYERGVVARSADATMTGDKVDVYLRATSSDTAPSSPTNNPSPLQGSNQLEKIIGDGRIVIVQPTRRAEGQHVVYTASDDKYVLSGGPPSIFDAEHRRVTGDSLTFYKRDDRVFVQGDGKSPAVTQTRVAR